MTWPFENNTNGIVKNLAKRNLKSEKRRNVMVIVSVVLSAFLISLSGLTGVSLMQTEKKKVIDTYEATYVQVDETHIEAGSYTHLDVYKRQTIIRTKRVIRPNSEKKKLIGFKC